jgi:hypothetical protein
MLRRNALDAWRRQKSPQCIPANRTPHPPSPDSTALRGQLSPMTRGHRRYDTCARRAAVGGNPGRNGAEVSSVHARLPRHRALLREDLGARVQALGVCHFCHNIHHGLIVRSEAAWQSPIHVSWATLAEERSLPLDSQHPSPPWIQRHEKLALLPHLRPRVFRLPIGPARDLSRSV